MMPAGRPPPTDRITGALIPKAGEDLQLLQDRAGLSRTDLVNRALSLYESVKEAMGPGGQGSSVQGLVGVVLDVDWWLDPGRRARWVSAGLSTISGMAISIAEYNRLVNEWTSARWHGSRPCPMCGTSAGWELAPIAELPIRSADLEGQPAGKAIPVVPLTCKNCAYVACFSAVAMGVLARDPVPGEAGRP